MHYELNQARQAGEDDAPDSGPGLVPPATSIEVASSTGLIFGVSLEARPSCSSTPADVASDEEES